MIRIEMCIVSYRIVISDTVRYDTIRPANDTIRYDTIRGDTIQLCFRKKRRDTIRYDTPTGDDDTPG